MFHKQLYRDTRNWCLYKINITSTKTDNHKRYHVTFTVVFLKILEVFFLRRKSEVKKVVKHYIENIKPHFRRKPKNLRKRVYIIEYREYPTTRVHKIRLYQVPVYSWVLSRT